MNNRAASPLFAVTVAVGLCATGCTTVAKQAFHELRGAQADVHLNQCVARDALARCQSVRFAPATTTLNSKLCPPTVIRAYDRRVTRQLSTLGEFYPGGAPELQVNTDLQFFQAKGLLSGALLLARVKMYTDGTMVADTVVITESKSFREGGGVALGETAAEAIVKWLLRQRQE